MTPDRYPACLGTVSIIAALEVATGQVVAEPISRNDPVTFTGFLHRLDQ